MTDVEDVLCVVLLHNTMVSYVSIITSSLIDLNDGKNICNPSEKAVLQL